MSNQKPELDELRAFLQTDAGKALMAKMQDNIDRMINPLHGIDSPELAGIIARMNEWKFQPTPLVDIGAFDMGWEFRLRGYGCFGVNVDPTL